MLLLRLVALGFLEELPLHVLVLCLCACHPHVGFCGGIDILDVLNEVLLAPAGGLDRRRLLDSLGAAAAKEEDAAEHRAENTHGELWWAAC